MIHFHGGPFAHDRTAVTAWRRRHACVSFHRPEQMALACEVAQSVMVDNGAFAKWIAGEGQIDADAYFLFVDQWRRHPAFEFCIIPDVVDGAESENARLVEEWPLSRNISVPVWHMHESLDRLSDLVYGFPRVALGSSGEFSEIGTLKWWSRMAEAMAVACDEEGLPRAKLHGLRMLNPTLCSHIPFASADSTNVARNVGIDKKWQTGRYQAMSQTTRALILMERIELHASAARWAGTMAAQMNLELIG